MSDDQKPYGLAKIVPPYDNYYQYFQEYTDHPFEFQRKPEEFSMTNAWWLIEASILSYSKEPNVIKEFTKVGFEVDFFDGESTQCYLASNKDSLILVFRGTQIWGGEEETNPFKIINAIFKDIIADFKFRCVAWEGEGKVHHGFKDALNEVWENKGLFGSLKNKDDGNRTFWFTGHSLGAALATLAWKRYCREVKGTVPGLYTFGSPLVGNNIFGKGFETTFRFVNNNDIVTKVPPPPIGYHHVGCLKHINNHTINTYSNSAREVENYFEMEDFASLDSSTKVNEFSCGINKVSEKIQDFLPFNLEIKAYFNSFIENTILGMPELKNSQEVINALLCNLLPSKIFDHVPILYSRFIKENIFQK